jgi:hypothetical protein
MALPFMVCLGPGGATTATFDSAGWAREEAEVGVLDPHSSYPRYGVDLLNLS